MQILRIVPKLVHANAYQANLDIGYCTFANFIAISTVMDKYECSSLHKVGYKVVE